MPGSRVRVPPLLFVGTANTRLAGDFTRASAPKSAPISFHFRASSAEAANRRIRATGRPRCRRCRLLLLIEHSSHVEMRRFISADRKPILYGGDRDYAADDRARRESVSDAMGERYRSSRGRGIVTHPGVTTAPKNCTRTYAFSCRGQPTPPLAVAVAVKRYRALFKDA
jgi:hypothetical protein